MCATTVEGIFIFETQAQSHMKAPMALRENVAPERFHHLKLQNDKFDGSLTDPQRIEELKLSEVRFHSRITCCTETRPDHGDRIYYFHAKFMCTNRIWWRKSFQTMPGKYILHVVFLLHDAPRIRLNSEMWKYFTNSAVVRHPNLLQEAFGYSSSL